MLSLIAVVVYSLKKDKNGASVGFILLDLPVRIPLDADSEVSIQNCGWHPNISRCAYRCCFDVCVDVYAYNRRCLRVYMYM